MDLFLSVISCNSTDVYSGQEEESQKKKLLDRRFECVYDCSNARRTSKECDNSEHLQGQGDAEKERKLARDMDEVMDVESKVEEVHDGQGVDEVCTLS